MQVISKIWTWFWSWIPFWEARWTAATVDDAPDDPDENLVYLVEEGGEVWQVVMACPCGCKARIQLCCVPDSRPRWTFQVHEDNTITLHPSVWRTVGCRSHFFLRRGRVAWC